MKKNSTRFLAFFLVVILVIPPQLNAALVAAGTYGVFRAYGIQNPPFETYSEQAVVPASISFRNRNPFPSVINLWGRTLAYFDSEGGQAAMGYGTGAAGDYDKTVRLVKGLNRMLKKQARASPQESQQALQEAIGKLVMTLEKLVTSAAPDEETVLHFLKLIRAMVKRLERHAARHPKVAPDVQTLWEDLSVEVRNSGKHYLAGHRWVLWFRFQPEMIQWIGEWKRIRDIGVKPQVLADLRRFYKVLRAHIGPAYELVKAGRSKNAIAMLQEAVAADHRQRNKEIPMTGGFAAMGRFNGGPSLDIILRPATAKDLADAVFLRRSAFPLDAGNPVFEQGFDDWFRSTLKPDSDAFIFIAEHKGAIVGLMSCRKTGTEIVELGEGAVHPSSTYRRQGIAEALGHAVLVEVKRRWPTVKTTETFMRDDKISVIQFLLKLGFTEDSSFSPTGEYRHRYMLDLATDKQHEDSRFVQTGARIGRYVGEHRRELIISAGVILLLGPLLYILERWFFDDPRDLSLPVRFWHRIYRATIERFVSIEGLENLPLGQACLFVGNHINLRATDTVLMISEIAAWMPQVPSAVGITNPRGFFWQMLAWLMAYYKIILKTSGEARMEPGSPQEKGEKTVARMIQFFKTNPTGILVVHSAGEAMAEGKLEEFGDWRTGAAATALVTKTPIIPFYISGIPFEWTPITLIFHWLQWRIGLRSNPPLRVTIRIGAPIQAVGEATRENARALTNQIKAAVEALNPAAAQPGSAGPTGSSGPYKPEALLRAA